MDPREPASCVAVKELNLRYHNWATAGLLKYGLGVYGCGLYGCGVYGWGLVLGSIIHRTRVQIPSSKGSYFFL